MRTLLKLSLVFSILAWTDASAQGVDGAPCFEAQEIRVPLNNENFSLNDDVFKREDLDINLVYYQDDDYFTFWYKFIVTEDCELAFKIAATNEIDDYDFLIYQYNGGNFCDTMRSKPLRPINANIYRELGDAITNIGRPGKAYLNKIEVKAGNTYYLSVLSLTPNDCGHKMFVRTTKQTLIVSAVHNPCFVFEQPPQDVKIEAELSETVYVTGVVFDQHSETPIRAEIQIIDDKTGKIIKVISEYKNGYKVELRRDETYSLECSSFGYDNIYGKIEFYNSTVYNFYLPQVKEGRNVVMENIYFHPNTYAFQAQSGEELERLWNFLKSNPEVNIEIQGHTAGNTAVKEVRKTYVDKGPEWTFTGSAKKLSKMRADAVRKYLVENGVSADRIGVRGFGAEVQRFPNPESKEQHMKNMRVEIMIVQGRTRH
jgi:hypothetical protein